MKVQAVTQVPERPAQAVAPQLAGSPDRGPATDGAAAKQSPTGEELEQAVDKMNKAAEVASNHLSFSIHQATKRIVVRVIDDNSGQVIREIPPEAMLDAAAEMQRMIGIMFDMTI